MRITIGLLAIILLGIAMLDSYAYAQGPTSIGNKEPGHFIRRWLALGPIIEGEPAPKAIETDYLLAATGILESKFATLEGAPKAGEGVTLTLEGYVTQERIWKVLELPENDSVDAMLVAEGEIDFSVAYLVTFIESKEATRRELKIGSDDAVKVWLNGEVVHTAAVNRPLTPDQDKVAVDLKEGMNCLMVKAADSTLDWKLTIRFLNESGLQFFDTPNRQILSLGRRLIHLSNPQFETPEHGGKGIEGLWKTYRYIDGLAGNRVTAFMQDKEGAIWFATDGGANRFDGVSWKTYTQKDGLASNDVRDFVQDREGAIWFGTWGGGVSRFDGKSWKTYTQKDGLANDDVWDIIEDREGVIWVGTWAGGISRFDGKSWKTYTQKDGLADNRVRAIIQDKEGTIWVGTWAGGISRFDGKSWKTYTQKDGLASNSINAIMQDREGTIWFATAGSGVSQFDGKNWKTYTQKDGLVNNIVIATMQDREGAIWFGTLGGISRFDGKGWKTYTQKDGLVNNMVLAIMQDREGIIWLGTNGSGVSRFDRKSWKTYTQKDGLANNIVWDIIEEDEGAIWFGTWGGGVSRFDGKSWKTYTQKDGLANNTILAIMQDREGIIWFATAGSGVSQFDGKSWKTYTQKDGLANNTTRAIMQDKEGAMWFGTGDGASRFDGKSWKTYTQKDGLANNDVRDIMQDRGGIIWFGTRGGGVNRFDGKSWKTYTQKDGLAGNIVRAIMQDREGAIWFGTFGGISRFDGKSWKTYTQKDGLANDDVSDIMQDKEGVIWIGTYSGGVSRFDGKCFQTIDSRDGLVNDSVSSIYMDRSEQIWFGTQDGAVQFTPNKVPPLLYITQVLADEKTYLRPSESLNLQSGIRRVVFSFRAISFKTRPGGIKYFYQLVGKDSDWQGPTNNETVEYFDLKSGQYTFKVQAVDRDLNYSKIASVTFKIRPPFYMTTAFIVPTVSLSTILLVAFMYLSITFFKHRKQILAYQKFAVQELQDARQMQMSLIPENAPPLEGFEIAGKCISANTVGGDFFDYLQTKNQNQLGIVIGDVTGKGLKGAMNAVMTDGILHSIAKGKERLSPASLLMEINDILKDRMERDMNVTMVIGLIDAESQTLTLANAGHHIYPILLRNGEIRFLKAKGLPVGVKAGIKYGEEQFPLGNGDAVIFMTDGIIEAKGRGEAFGSNASPLLYLESGRLEQTISQFSRDISAEAMVDAIIADAMDFGGSKDSRDDDMTVVVVKVL